MVQLKHPNESIFGQAREIELLRAQIRRLATFDTPGNPYVPSVLVLGETGTGKGLVARVLHDSGPRACGPFIDVNCAAIPETMLEAELFGYEAGAFTDAKRGKPGLFEAAVGGTLFLDEIDSLSAVVQSKLLKAIEEKRVRRLGALQAHEVDVKLIAATQRDLPALVAAGGFRADLYHRLAVLLLTIPPLRARGDDVLGLAELYLGRLAAAHGLAPKRLTDSGRAWLLAQPWPGNVRELSHLMERITLLGVDDDVDAGALEALAAPPLRAPAPVEIAAPAATASGPDGEEAERIAAALARAGGNVVRAAQLLGLGRNALRYRMRRLGIQRPDLGDPSPSPPPAAAAPPAPARPAATEPAAAWEQKTVAVLALSLTLPDSEAGSYDPWTAARRWQRGVGERVAGFGGVVIGETPARLTAVFGVPRAIEQSAQRAVWAALAIQRAAAHGEAPRPALRAAVHVADVRLDTGAADLAIRLLPIGDAFSLPERLLGHAGAGEVLLSAAAARRGERDFTLAPRPVQLGPTEADRQTVHTVLGLTPHATQVESPDAGVTRFVGRNRELALLLDAFERAADGHGQVVFLAGEAGIGKSRLLAELRQQLADRPHRWIEGRCASYGTATPFLPLIDAIRRLLRIDDTDDEASAGAKIESDVARLGTDLAWTLPFVKQLLSLEIGDPTVAALDSASRRSELFRGLRALLLRDAEVAPLVVVIEDLHWIDPASEEWLAFIADAIPGARILLVLSHRSGYRHPFPDRSYHVPVSLAPLSGGDMEAMTGAVLGAAQVPEELRALIATKAEGNPFFVEELVHSLLEDGALRREGDRVVLTRGIDDLVVPDTVQDLLGARIDRLAEGSRRAIQIASVIGREFALRLLARLTEAGERIRGHVEELRSLELIYEKALHPELAYMFKHALTHDVAYESVQLAQRRHLHVAIGRTIEELYADRLAEHYETLAHHFGRGEDWPRALLYHERSSEKAAATHANRAASEHCRQALAIADRLGEPIDPERRRLLSERLGQACYYLSEFAASGAAFEDAAAHSAVPELRALTMTRAAFSYLWAHRYEAGRRCIAEAHAIADGGEAPAGRAMALVIDGWRRTVLDADLETFEGNRVQAEAICRRHPNERVEGTVAMLSLMLHEWRGEYPATIAGAEQAIAVGRRLRIPDLIILPTWFLGKARACTGDYGGAIALLEEAYALCDRIGDRAWKSRLLNTLGWCFAEIGSVESARDYNERAAALARTIGDPEILANADINLAANHLALGDHARASAYLEPIEAALATPGDPWMRWRYALHVRHTRACIELAAGRPDAALPLLDAELQGARQHRVAKVEVRALLRRGAALLDLERRDDAAADLQAAAAQAEAMGYRHGIWDAQGLLAELARRAGQPHAATHAAQAAAALQAAAASLHDDQLRGRLLALSRW